MDEGWTELLQCAKNLIDAQLEDGEKCISEFLIFFYFLGPLGFSSKTESCEKNVFDTVHALLAKLPSAEGRYHHQQQ